jgi:hypothetical protein
LREAALNAGEASKGSIPFLPTTLTGRQSQDSCCLARRTRVRKREHDEASMSTPTAALPFHPLADLFPLMEGREFDELAADIKVNGLHECIVLLDDQILDGRNRYRACIAAGVEPLFVPYRGDDPVGYVVSCR